jgi:bacillithiol synthase
MSGHVERIPVESTGYFSKIVTDYINESSTIRPFYKHAMSFEGIEASIVDRKSSSTNRALLVDELNKQYSLIGCSVMVQQQIDSLLQENTFTVCTAHQPNIFTGHLYFVYKILHAIALAKELTERFAGHHFVPVYYMGSEDADLDELGHINIDGEPLVWETNQTGAVGRMKTKGLEKMIERLNGQFGTMPFGREIIEIFQHAYTKFSNMQDATLYFVDALFGKYGLVVLMPDNAHLKREFNQVVKDELKNQFSYPLVQETAAQLGAHYKVQASGRPINLFYLDENGRNRIEQKDDSFAVLNTKIIFSEAEIMQMVDEHPERFSANVILRGVFQEMILPNVAFIGGGGEIAYWLELKEVFAKVGVPYPVLVLRNSFLLVNDAAQKQMRKLNLSNSDLFQSELDITKKLVDALSHNSFSLFESIQANDRLFVSLKNQAHKIDPTLVQHINALGHQFNKQLENVEKKMLRAEKKKHEASIRQLQKLRKQLFPNNSLQERVDNLIPFYAKYGFVLLDHLLANSGWLGTDFTIMQLDA